MIDWKMNFLYWGIEEGDKADFGVIIQKFKKNVRGELRYYYRKVDEDGTVLFTSVGYMTRAGRNKAVAKIVKLENAKIEEDGKE